MLQQIMNGIIPSVSLFVCFLNAGCLPEKFISENVPSIWSLGYPRASSRVLRFEMASWKCIFEELVRKSLIASPFMKPCVTPGGDRRYIGCIGRSRSVYKGF